MDSDPYDVVDSKRNCICSGSILCQPKLHISSTKEIPPALWKAAGTVLKKRTFVLLQTSVRDTTNKKKKKKKKKKIPRLIANVFMCRELLMCGKCQ